METILTNPGGPGVQLLNKSGPSIDSMTKGQYNFMSWDVSFTQCSVSVGRY